MSRFIKGGKFYVDGQEVTRSTFRAAGPQPPAPAPTAPPVDMPGGLNEVEGPVKELIIQQDWCMVFYGIPEKQGGLRDRLRARLKKHGLYLIDRGGSVYIGPRSPTIDIEVAKFIDVLKADYTNADKLIRLVPSHVSEVDALWFKDRITRNVLEDVKLVEESLDELQRAITGEVTIVDPKTEKPRNLVTLGYARIDAAKKLVESMEGVAFRFANSQGMTKEADRIRIRMEQLRAWVIRVEAGFTRFAAVERAREKKKEATK